MGSATYIEAPCRAALNRVQGMPFNWSLNPYRGCTHRCPYCYARASHVYLGLDAGEDFETKIFFKSNIASVLREEVNRPTWNREKIAIGTATDPYQPCEGRYRLTRSCIQVLLERRNPLSIVTKSTLIRRDTDLLAVLAHFAKVKVHFSVTTLDRDVWRLIEPGTPPPLQRLRAMESLAASGVECGVFLAPIVPLITDSAESIAAVARAAADHGASSFGSSVLRLAPFVKEHWFVWVDEHFPPMLSRYRRAFSSANAPREYLRFIEDRVETARLAAGFETNSMSYSANGDQSDPSTPRGHNESRQLRLPV